LTFVVEKVENVADIVGEFVADFRRWDIFRDVAKLADDMAKIALRDLDFVSDIVLCRACRRPGVDRRATIATISPWSVSASICCATLIAMPAILFAESFVISFLQFFEKIFA